MKTHRWSWLALLVAPTWLACLAPSHTPSERRVESPDLDGSLGEYRAGLATRVVADYDDYIELRSTSRTGAVMAGLSVEGGLEGLEPGVHEFGVGRRGASVLGCGGRSEGAWLWDRSTRDVVVEVEMQDDGDRHIQFHATWSDGSALDGSFTHVRPR